MNSLSLETIEISEHHSKARASIFDLLQTQNEIVDFFLVFYFVFQIFWDYLSLTDLTTPARIPDASPA